MEKSLDDIKRVLDVLSDIYDVVRIVDPIFNKVIYNGHNTNVAPSTVCYNVLEKNRFCSNCISLRALSENKTLIKFEMLNNEFCMVTGTPFRYKGGRYAIELFQDITHKSVWNSIISNTEENFTEAILRLNDSLFKDGLTEIFNRRFINERLPVEIFKQSISDFPACLFMIDINYFKRINDTYGHQGGDAILREFAALLKDKMPNATSWTARYGGDEFLIYLDQITKEQARKLAAEIYRDTEKHSFTSEDKTIKTTCSIGACMLQPEMDMHEWIKRADTNLYIAKSKRNEKPARRILYGI
ncbi:GGDEF domain-containing protein [Megasphaera paucivorans]|uniref:Diguanylate cyclase (GGDEF) domain-containing protein n=1 Tax=Megasphaera paucivorans TaxID=349095 RepID=A0A1H0BW69_9FIRM|nr:GGDEF domain-containing protein [Megasphaera paucivorans]SDN49845.1 diguanylate cyclase (GGDEF) domain-containing protein [Megasphaera paucivorans]